MKKNPWWWQEFVHQQYQVDLEVGRLCWSIFCFPPRSVVRWRLKHQQRWRRKNLQQCKQCNFCQDWNRNQPFLPLQNGQQQNMPAPKRSWKRNFRRIHFYPISGAMILLMEEIPNNHLGCIKPCKITGYLPYQLVIAGFFPSTATLVSIMVSLGDFWRWCFRIDVTSEP